MSDQRITLTIRGENMRGDAKNKLAISAVIDEGMVNKIMRLLIEEENKRGQTAKPFSPGGELK